MVTDRPWRSLIDFALPVARRLAALAGVGALGASVALAPIAVHAQSLSDGGYGVLARMIATAPVTSAAGGGATVSSRAAGAPVIVICQVQGPTVYGEYGTDNLYDELAASEQGFGPEYVPDADVWTGSNQQVAPSC
jgi:hypothetical protein